MIFPRRRGLLITFSGIDGAGKSTQIQKIRQHFKWYEREPLVIWSRGGYTPGLELLKAFLRRLGRGRIVPSQGPSRQRSMAFSRPIVRKIWLTFAIIDLLWLYGVWIRILMAFGRDVICDRYLWDTLIDFRLNFPQENVENWPLWWLLSWMTRQPDIGFMLLIPVEVSLKRSDEKGEPYRDSSEVLAIRLEQYHNMADQFQLLVFDGRRSISSLAEDISTQIFHLQNARFLEAA